MFVSYLTRAGERVPDDGVPFCQWRRQIVQNSGVKVYQSG